MDSAISAAARALSAGDPLAALQHVALREDASALALRGIAMAQLGEFKRAQQLLRRAERSFGHRQRSERARCVLARAEVALAARELRWPFPALSTAIETFVTLRDTDNAAHGWLLQARWLLLLGRLEEAESALERAELPAHATMLEARKSLVSFELAMRRGEAQRARQALRRTWSFAQRARIPALLAEVEQAAQLLQNPAARVLEADGQRTVTPLEVEQLLAADALVVDARRRTVRHRDTTLDLTRRPLLFGLLRALAEAWPGDVARDLLITEVLGARRIGASQRATLRVEMGRLRKALRSLAAISSTVDGFALTAVAGESLLLLMPLVESEGASLLALLADGEGWSTSALALALGVSQRVVQRTLSTLQQQDKVQSVGRGRTQRWLVAPSTAIATTMLLPSPPGVR